MSIPVNINGVIIPYPQTGDIGWGSDATRFAEEVASVLGKIGQSQAPVNNDIIVSPGNLSVTSGDLSVGGNASVTGNTTLTGNITVNGNSNLGNGTSDTTAISGILNVDSGVLYVDPTNNKVGINDATPSVELDVNGAVAITGNETVGGTLNVTGATSLSSTLAVTGDVAVNTNKFNVTASSGNTTIAGTLGVTGNTTLTGQALASDGTALLPSISFSSDTNTGLYRIGSDNIGFTVNGAINGQLTTNGWIISQQYACFIDEKANNTSGGSFSSGGWRTRVLNTTRGTNSITGSSLSSNQFTLPSGTYRIFAKAPAYYVGQHQAKIRNITDSTDTLIGSSERSPYSGADQSSNISIVSGIFTIASQKTFELQHQCATTFAEGFGSATNFSVVCVYSTVELWKLS